MGYVVLQKGMEPPSIDQMKAAFRGLPGFTQTDAPMMCKNSLGILVRGLDQEVAQQLQGNLAAQGVETDIAEQAALPALPVMRHVTRVECTPEALVIFDPIGRSFALEGKDILLIGAGQVSVIEFTRKNAAPTEPIRTGGLGVIDQMLFGNSGLPVPRPEVRLPEANYETVEEHKQRWMAEVVIRGGALRYNFEAENAGQILFHYLGDRRTNDVAENFKLLVQDMCRCAPEAALNRGAYYLREGNAQAIGYRGKNMFYDEMVWLLWRLSRGAV